MDVTDRGRRLLLISFENDLDSLKLAMRHRRWFKHLKHAAPERLLADDRWVSKDGSIEWRLLQGDFATLKFDAPPPDLIFFDPFSFKTDSISFAMRSTRSGESKPLRIGSSSTTSARSRRTRTPLEHARPS